MVDFELDKKWREVQTRFEDEYGDLLDLNSVIFMIGVQELGKGYQKFTKDQKLEVMHIGICSILMPFGHYDYTGIDKDGWPHFELIQKLPPLNDHEQQRLLKEAVVGYFDSLD